eukprot:TRINITY_DN6072_c1_g1_i3.p1 TRINITY_DN6072_c1_g1~~TRINITY_DN6072_c1_g1_i3.p1  ORF type:complete len:2475 (+),score=365.76 TRINITY_DN6072_c1_g1_i3:1752-9176(+)
MLSYEETLAIMSAPETFMKHIQCAKNLSTDCQSTTLFCLLKGIKRFKKCFISQSQKVGKQLSAKSVRIGSTSDVVFLAEIWKNVVSPKQMLLIQGFKKREKFKQDVHRAANYILNEMKEEPQVSLSPPSGISPRVITFLESGNLEQQKRVREIINRIKTHPSLPGQLQCDQVPDWAAKFERAFSDTDDIDENTFCEVWCKMSENKTIESVSDLVDEHLSKLKQNRKFRYEQMIDDVIKYIERDEQLRGLLNVDNLPDDWRNTFRKQCKYPECLSKKRFLQIWLSLNEIEKASPFITSRSQSWSIFQFAVDKLNLNRNDNITIGIQIEYEPMVPLRGTLLTPRMAPESTDQETHYKWITVSSTALRDTLRQEVLLPAPSFTTGNRLAVTADVAAVAALVLAVESFGPQIEVGVSGWLPAERDSSFSSLVRTPTIVCAVVVGIFLGISDLLVLSQRDWKLYLPGDFSGDREAVLFASTNTWAEDVRESLIVVWFVLMVSYSVHSGRNLERLGYRHARHQHLLFHMVRTVTLFLVIAAMIVFQFTKPTRHVENFRRRWDTMAFLGLGVPLYACFAVATCPPVVPRTLDPEDLNEQNYIAYLRDTGGSRLRFVRTIQEKEILLQAMQDAQIKEKKKPPASSFKEFKERFENSGEQAADILKDLCGEKDSLSTTGESEESETDEPQNNAPDHDTREHSLHHRSNLGLLKGDKHRKEMQQTFCIETAVNCFHCSTLAYETTDPFETKTCEEGCHKHNIEIKQDLQLSHDYPIAPKLLIDGRTRPSLYHYYYSQLLLHESPRDAKKVLQAATASEAKAAYHKLMDHRLSGDDVEAEGIRTSKKPICLPKAQKEALILKCLWAKYEQSAECRAVLLATGSRKLEDKKFDGLRTDHILSMIRRNSNDVLYISKELMEWRRELTSEKIITYSRKADEAIWAWVSEIDGRHEEMQHTVIEKLSASLFQLYQRDSEKKKRDRSYQSPLDKLKSNITNASERLNLFNSEVKIDPNMSYRLQKGVRHEEDAKLIVKLNTFEDIRRALFDETDVIFQDEVLTAIFSHCHKENISLCINSMISDVFGSGERGVYLKACESAKKNYAKLLQAASENTLLSLSEEYDISCSTFNVNSHHILSTLLKNVDSVGRAASKLRKFLEELTIRSLQLDCDIDALNMAERNGMLSTWDEVDKPRGTIVWRTLIEAMHLSTPPVPFSKVLLRTGRKTLVDSNYQSGHVIAPLGTGLHEVPEVTVHCSEEVTVTERYMEKVMRYAELEDVRVLFKEMLSLILEYQPADGIYQFDSEDEEHPSSQDEQPSPAGSYRTLSESRRSQGLLNNVDIFIRILEKCEREVIENRLALYVDGTGFKGQDSIFTQSEYDKWKQSKELLRKTTTKLVTQFEAAFREYIVDVTARSMKKQGTRKKLSLLEEWLHLYNNSYVDISDDIGETVYSILHKKLPVANSRTLLKLGNADLKGTAPSFDNVTEAFMMIREALQRRPKESKIAVEKKYGWLKKAGYSLVTKFTSKDGDTKRTLCRLSCSRYKAKTDNLDDENYPGQTTCWILKKGDSHYISFRGTILMQQGKTDLRNALTDITCCLTDMEVPGEGKVGVHKGFYKLWLNLREQIYRIMEENPEVKEIFYPKSSNNPLIFTGHSLGGALATLAALDFATDKSGRSDRNIIVYNFGCPRIGNAAFAQLCEKYVPESYRIINKGDMVPIMPPNFVWYQHAGHPVLLNSSGEFLVDSTFAERIILPYFQPSFFYRPHAHRRGGDGGNGYGNGIRRMAGNNNLRDMGELLYALRSGSKYSPEFRNLWTSQVSSSDPDEHHQAVFLKEAVSVCEEPPQVALSIPIVVYYCKLRSNTLVAASNQTRNWAIAHGYRQVCELGLVFTHPRGDGTSHSKKDLVPLYLYYNSKRRDHMLCATELECQNAEAKHYVRRSLEGYVFPATAETPSIATKAVTLTWRPKLQDHSILEANKFLPDSTNTIEVLHNQGFRILEKPRLSIVPKVWASLGYLPVCLFSGLLTVAIGEKRDAPLVAFITAIIIFSLGFALTMSVQIVRFPRSVDVAYIFSYGLLYVSTHHLNISLTDTDKLVVPLLVVTHSIAVLATVIGDHPFNEDNWQEDGTIPPGIAKKPEFVFIVRIYANTHLAASLLLSLIVFIPALMSRDELDSDYNEMFSAIGSICFFLLVHLYHHAMVFYCLKFLTTSAIGENIGATQARYRMSRYVHDFCQLFPEVPSIITGQFTIRDTDQSSELLHFPTGKQITHEVSTDNDEYYEEELGELLGFPAVLINAVATKSEGVDGRWGAEIRFNLVCRTNNEAVAMKNRMISLFSSGSRGRSKKNRGDVGQAHEKELERCNWFPHTMRSVKLVDFKTPSIESFQQFGLLDISFTRHGRYPPFHQPAKALQIAREMAMLLKVPTHNLQQVRRNHRNSNDKRSVKGQDPKELSSSLYKSSGDRLQSVTQFAGTVGGRGLGLGPRAESSIPLD